MNKIPVIYAHRGGGGLFPETTLPAYQNAVILGCAVLDIDVAITKDNVIVGSHDPFLNVDFTQNADGQWLTDNSQLIRNFTFEELQQFDVGQINPNTAYVKRYPGRQSVKGARIPSLQQIFAVAQDHPQIRFQLEIKTNPSLPDVTANPQQFMTVLNNLLNSSQMSSRVEVHSFDWRNMLCLQKLNQQVTTSYITSTVEMTADVASLWHAGYDVAEYDNNYPTLIKFLGGKIWCPDFRDVTVQSVIQAHQQGLKIVSWTVNEIADMQRAIEYGLDGIITDYPDRLLKLLAEKR